MLQEKNRRAPPRYTEIPVVQSERSAENKQHKNKTIKSINTTTVGITININRSLITSSEELDCDLNLFTVVGLFIGRALTLASVLHPLRSTRYELSRVELDQSSALQQPVVTSTKSFETL